VVNSGSVAFLFDGRTSGGCMEKVGAVGLELCWLGDVQDY